MLVTSKVDLQYKGQDFSPHFSQMIASEVCLSSLHNLLLLIMRKIESQMIAAINSSKNWQSANTSVHFNEESNTSIVRLHGNKIAEVTDDSMTIFDGGWQTVTTKSRLNALINEFCNAVTDGVFQKNYQWFVTDNNVTKEFTNGYVFA